MRMVKNKKAFTLTELVMAVALLLIVVSLMFTVFEFASKAFDKGKGTYNSKNKAVIISKTLRNSLDTASYYIINFDGNIPLKEGETDYYMSNDRLMVKKYNEAETVLEDGEYNVIFEVGKDTGWDIQTPQADRINNLVEIRIIFNETSRQKEYTLATSVHIKNIENDSTIIKLENLSGNKIRIGEK